MLIPLIMHPERNTKANDLPHRLTEGKLKLRRRKFEQVQKMRVERPSKNPIVTTYDPE